LKRKVKRPNFITFTGRSIQKIVKKVNNSVFPQFIALFRYLTRHIFPQSVAPTQENAALASKKAVEIPASNSYGPVTPKQLLLSLKANRFPFPSQVRALLELAHPILSTFQVSRSKSNGRAAAAKRSSVTFT